MATYVLIHGAGSDSWYWHLVRCQLEERGHVVITPDLPCEDDAAGLAEYTEVVLASVGDHRDDPELVVVGQSLAGFTAPLVCDRLPARLLVLVAAMVPAPGEPPGEWWANTGWEDAYRDAAVAAGRPTDGPFDPLEDFLHDVPDDITAALLARGERGQSGTPFEKPWPLDRWPDVPTRFLLCRDDRFFPADFQRRVVQDRLGLVPDEMAGGHLPALAHPDELVEQLERFLGDVR